MITGDKQKQALDALHRILVLARFMAYKNESSAEIAKILDHAEILPTLISADEDLTEEFRRELQGLAAHFRAGIGILQAFDR